MSEKEQAIYMHIKKYAKSNDLKAALYLLFSFAGYVAGFYLPYYLFPLHSLFFSRFFMGFHDMGHGFFFKTRYLNTVLGTLSGTLLSTSFDQWCLGHNEHHKVTNDLIYPQYSQTALFTVDQFRELTPFYQKIYKGLTGNRLVLLTIMPIYLGIISPLFTAKNNHEKLLLIAYLYFIFKANLLAHYMSCVLLSEMIGFIFFHSQHTFDSAKRRKGMDHFESAMAGTSFMQVPEILKWATGAIEYHHIHHLSIAVPLYNLRACHDEAPPEMFASVKRITFWEALESLKYTLYDEEEDRLISFTEYEQKEDN